MTKQGHTRTLALGRMRQETVREQTQAVLKYEQTERLFPIISITQTHTAWHFQPKQMCLCVLLQKPASFDVRVTLWCVLSGWEVDNNRKWVIQDFTRNGRNTNNNDRGDTRVSHDMLSVLSMAANNQQQHKQESPSDWLFVTSYACVRPPQNHVFPFRGVTLEVLGIFFFFTNQTNQWVKNHQISFKKNHKNKDDI